jgi:protein involved in polysaccharide export with SLBB domain
VKYPGSYSVLEGTDKLSELIGRAGGLLPAADLARARLVRRAATAVESGADRTVELLQGFDPDQMTYEEYAFLTSQRVEPRDQVSVDFVALLVQGDTSADVSLLNADLVEIPRALDVVRVSGAVKRPGFVRFEAGARAKDYIALAGGYTRDADRRGTRVVKAQSGSRLRPLPAVRVEPGDIVWVPRTKDRDWWVIAKDVLGVLGQVATIALVIDGINKK